MIKRKKTISNAGIVVFESLTNNEAIANRTPEAVVRIRPRLDLQQLQGRKQAGDFETDVWRFCQSGSFSMMRSLQVWLRICFGDVKLRKLSLSLSNKTRSSVSSWMLPSRDSLFGRSKF